MNQNDPFAYIIELCRISPSQEEILRNCPFVGETVDLHDDEATSSLRGMPVASKGIAMASLTETPQEGGKYSSGPQDIFHTPPEDSSLPTSGDQLRSVDFDNCTVNQAVDIDDETLGFANLCGYAEGAEFVDLGDDSDLGFPDLKLRQRVDRELVAECSRGIDRAGVSEISRSALNKFRVLERDGLGELPLKKMKFSEQNSGFDSSHGIETEKVGEDMGNSERKLVSNTENPCNLGADSQPQHNVLIGKEMSFGIDDDENTCGETSVDKKLGSCENLGSLVIQSEIAKSAGNLNFHDNEESAKNSESREETCEAEKLPCTGEGNKSTDEVVETSEWQKSADKQPVSRVLPSSIRGCLEKAAKKSGSGEGNISVFDVLKVLKENSDEDRLANVSLWKVTKINGITFPRPWWRTKEGTC